LKYIFSINVNYKLIIFKVQEIYHITLSVVFSFNRSNCFTLLPETIRSGFAELLQLVIARAFRNIVA